MLDYRTMVFRVASVAVVLGLLAGPAAAAQLKGGYFACVSEASWKELTQAVARNDRRGADYLVNQGQCVVTKAGLPVSVLHTTWTGTAKVRVYLGDTAVVVWTNTENVQQ